jgi:hypothetical protein
MREAIVGTDDGEDPLSVLDIEYGSYRREREVCNKEWWWFVKEEHVEENRRVDASVLSPSPIDYLFFFVFNRKLDGLCEPGSPVQICGYNVKVILLFICKVFVKPTHMCHIETQFFRYKVPILVSWTKRYHSNYRCDRLDIYNAQASISSMMTCHQCPIRLAI